MTRGFLQRVTHFMVITLQMQSWRQLPVIPTAQETICPKALILPQVECGLTKASKSGLKMNGVISFFLFLATVATGFSQSLSLATLGEPFQRTNLDVHWEVTGNALPRTAWIYRVLPRAFPPAAISNLARECGFEEKDKQIFKGDVIYKNADKFASICTCITYAHNEYSSTHTYTHTHRYAQTTCIAFAPYRPISY